MRIPEVATPRLLVVAIWREFELYCKKKKKNPAKNKKQILSAGKEFNLYLDSD